MEPRSYVAGSNEDSSSGAGVTLAIGAVGALIAAAAIGGGLLANSNGTGALLLLLPRRLLLLWSASLLWPDIGSQLDSSDVSTAGCCPCRPAPPAPPPALPSTMSVGLDAVAPSGEYKTLTAYADKFSAEFGSPVAGPAVAE